MDSNQIFSVLDEHVAGGLKSSMMAWNKKKPGRFQGPWLDLSFPGQFRKAFFFVTSSSDFSSFKNIVLLLCLLSKKQFPFELQYFALDRMLQKPVII